MIYAVEILERRFIKIGYSASDDVTERIAALQTGNPFEIRPLISVRGTLMQEQSLHGALRVAFARTGMPVPPNEWYPGRHPFFVGFLNELEFGFDAGITFLHKMDPAVRQPGKDGERHLKLQWPTFDSKKARRERQR